MNTLRSLQLKSIETCVAKQKADCAAKISNTHFLDCQRQAQQAAAALQQTVGQVGTTLARFAGAERLALWRLSQMAPQLKGDKEVSQKAEGDLNFAKVELGQRLALCHRIEKIQEKVEERIECCVGAATQKKRVSEIEEQQELRICKGTEQPSADPQLTPLLLSPVSAQTPVILSTLVGAPSSAATAQTTQQMRGEVLAAERIVNLQSSRDGSDVRLACNYRLLDGTEVKIEIAHNPQLGLEILVRAGGERERRQLWREKAQLLAALKAAGYAPKSVRFELEAQNQEG
jgi:hypothetical protein